MEIFLRNPRQTRNFPDENLKALEEHLGTDAEHEVVEPPGTDEDLHELDDAPGTLEVAGHLGTAHRIISAGVHTA